MATGLDPPGSGHQVSWGDGTLRYFINEGDKVVLGKTEPLWKGYDNAYDDVSNRARRFLLSTETPLPLASPASLRNFGGCSGLRSFCS